MPFSYTDCSTISAFLVQSSIGFHHIFLVESNRSLFTRIHLCQHLYLVAFHKDRFWVRFFSFYTLPLSLLSSNVIRSSIIHTPMTPNSRTLLLRIAFRTSLTLRLCIDDIKDWMTANKLKLNDDKTEVMIISTSRMSTALSIPDSFDIGNASVPFSDTVKNLGVTLDCHLSLKTHVLNLVRTANFELRRIGSIRSLLTTEATATLVSAFILSRLDYCNSLLSGSPRSLILRLQKVQNNAARLILRISKREHISPHLAPFIGYPLILASSTNLHVFATTLCQLTLRPTSLTFLLFTPLPVSFAHVLTTLSSVVHLSVPYPMVKDLSHTPPLLLGTLFLSRSALLIVSLLSDPELKLTFSVLPTNCLN